ncbi:uncharacterized protein LOC128234232 [Mya arenaria]|uniref:uncharacterized protein LOC128234232 n=1 Tax=Mya arenaria TaxID=6604 RepID=UPI0022E89B95|nr:uncharacterized protein LOC128234232 [Mya arenaria]
MKLRVTNWISAIVFVLISKLPLTKGNVPSNRHSLLSTVINTANHVRRFNHQASPQLRLSRPTFNAVQAQLDLPARTNLQYPHDISLNQLKQSAGSSAGNPNHAVVPARFTLKSVSSSSTTGTHFVSPNVPLMSQRSRSGNQIMSRIYVPNHQTSRATGPLVQQRQGTVRFGSLGSSRPIQLRHVQRTQSTGNLLDAGNMLSGYSKVSGTSTVKCDSCRQTIIIRCTQIRCMNTKRTIPAGPGGQAFVETNINNDIIHTQPDSVRMGISNIVGDPNIIANGLESPRIPKEQHQLLGAGISMPSFRRAQNNMVSKSLLGKDPFGGQNNVPIPRNSGVGASTIEGMTSNLLESVESPITRVRIISPSINEITPNEGRIARLGSANVQDPLPVNSIQAEPPAISSDALNPNKDITVELNTEMTQDFVPVGKRHGPSRLAMPNQNQPDSIALTEMPLANSHGIHPVPQANDVFQHSASLEPFSKDTVLPDKVSPDQLLQNPSQPDIEQNILVSELLEAIPKDDTVLNIHSIGDPSASSNADIQVSPGIPLGFIEIRPTAGINNRSSQESRAPGI